MIPVPSTRLSIRLDKGLSNRLDRLVRLTGRSKSFYVKQALEEQVADLEDLYLARKVARRVADGREEVVTLEDLEREFAVEN